MLNMQKEKYMQLMQKIEDLEDRIEIMELKEKPPVDLEKLLEQLAESRNELARVSDGCGTPHHH